MNVTDININNFQYILDRFVKIDWNKDGYDNIFSQKVPNEPHSVTTDSNGNQFIILNQIPDGEAIVTVNNVLDITSEIIPAFIPYTRVNSLAEIVTNRQFYFDKDNFRIYFKGIPENQTIAVTYNAFGRACLSANMVYTDWDSNGNIIQLLGELVRESKQSLKQIQGITNAESLRLQLDSQVNSLMTMYEIIRENEPLAQQLSNELSIKVPDANQAVTNINTALTNAQDAINTITMADNQYYTIQANQLVYNASSELYEYTLTHNLNSVKLNIQIRDEEGDGLLNLCKVVDNNNLLVRNDEQCILYITINKGYYGGA